MLKLLAEAKPLLSRKEAGWQTSSSDELWMSILGGAHQPAFTLHIAFTREAKSPWLSLCSTLQINFQI
jgi:hypothetical protein